LQKARTETELHWKRKMYTDIKSHPLYDVLQKQHDLELKQMELKLRDKYTGHQGDISNNPEYKRLMGKYVNCRDNRNQTRWSSSSSSRHRARRHRRDRRDRPTQQKTIRTTWFGVQPQTGNQPRVPTKIVPVTMAPPSKRIPVQSESTKGNSIAKTMQ